MNKKIGFILTLVIATTLGSISGHYLPIPYNFILSAIIGLLCGYIYSKFFQPKLHRLDELAEKLDVDKEWYSPATRKKAEEALRRALKEDDEE